MHSIISRIHRWDIVAAVSVIILSLIGLATVTSLTTSVYPESNRLGIRLEATGIKPITTPIIAVNRASARSAAQADPCANCAVVDSIIVNEVKATGSAVDLPSGGVSADQTAATSSYRVNVRMDDGTYRSVSQRSRPDFRVGEKVKIVNGAIVPFEGTSKMDANRIFALVLTTLTSRAF